MGIELTNLSMQDLCDLMCGQVEDDLDNKDCKKCKNYMETKRTKYAVIYTCKKTECKFERAKNEG